MFTKTIYAAGALAFITGAQAHVVMNTPTPYGFSTLQSSPLNGEGYNFPCQSGSREGAYDATGVYNPMVVGKNNPLKFTGSAVHGGGSCQLSVTYEYPPPADKSKWRVIQSFVGGCPASATGNISPGTPSTDKAGHATGLECSGDSGTECIKDYQFQIPQGMKNGNATLAWTWFNKIGNREMYMNCAPISISGGSDDDTYFNSLPEIFVANIPGECMYEDQSAVVGFPNPGKNVVYGEAVTTGTEGSCPKAAASGSSGSSSAAPTYGASSSYAASVSSAAPTYAAPSSYAAAPPSASSFALSLDVPYLTFSAEGNARTTFAASSAATTSAASSAAIPTAAADESETTTVFDNVETTIVNYTTMVTVTGSPAAATSAVATSVVATSAVATSAAAYSPARSSVASAIPTVPSSNNYSSGTSSSNGSCGEGKVSCSSPGNIICIDETHFGLCNIDNCAVPEALAHGTSCADGVINASVVARRSNRHHRHAAGHMHKRNF